MHIPDLERILIDPDARVTPASLVGRRLGDVTLGELINAAAQDPHVSEGPETQPMHIAEEMPDGDSTYL